MKIPEINIPIQEIPLDKNVRLFIKREDLIHPEISGNKYWKLLYNINHYLEQQKSNPLLITFGGAFSNHVAAVAALGKDINIKTLGIIRGEELAYRIAENPTLSRAQNQGMEFHFVTREAYRDKINLAQTFQKQYPDALIIPEGGTNDLAIKGVKYMLDNRTKEFNYLCSAVGSGGTISGIAKHAEDHQKIIGFKAVRDDSLADKIKLLSGKNSVTLVDAHYGGFGKLIDENIAFINAFYQLNRIPLDPVYTGKMMLTLLRLIEEDYFPENSKILAFHTGGLQGIAGANQMLKKQNRTLIQVN